MKDNRKWIHRNTIIWYKKNCMPSSAKDRFTINFEYIYFFSKSNETQYWTNSKTKQLVNKQPLGIQGIEGKDWEWKDINDSWERPSRDEVHKIPGRSKSTYAKAKKKKVSLWTSHDYYFEQQFEEHSRDWAGCGGNIAGKGIHKKNDKIQYIGKRNVIPNSQGRNKRCVWKITTQPYAEAHFAVYPEELCITPIKAGCPEFVCKRCGKPKEKIFKTEKKKCPPIGGIKQTEGNQNPTYSGNTEQNIITGFDYTNCGCNAGFNPGIVLDPFSGAGTTCLTARKLGRQYIGIEIKQEYVTMAEKRIHNEAGLL